MSKNETKVIALNTILRTLKSGDFGDRAKGIPPTKPVVQTIEPGSVFQASMSAKSGENKSEYETLMAQGAIRDWNAQDEAVLNRMSNIVGGGEFTEPLDNGNGGNGNKQTTAGKRKAATAAAKITEGTGGLAGEDNKVKKTGAEGGDGGDGEGEDVV